MRDRIHAALGGARIIANGEITTSPLRRLGVQESNLRLEGQNLAS